MTWEACEHLRSTMRSTADVPPGHHMAEMGPDAHAATAARSEFAAIPPEARSPAHGNRGLAFVLIVDDDDVTRKLIAANLILAGFYVATAVDWQNCLEKVSAIAPDIIILDVTMPRLEGWKIAAQLRNGPNVSVSKLVLISARSRENDEQCVTYGGVDACLTKLFDPAEMIRVVRELAGARAWGVSPPAPAQLPHLLAH